MFDYEDEEQNGLDESGSEKFIDPNDLIMIEDNHNFKPTENFILGYATQLGFDIENDPPEMLNIAEKYLSKSIPDIYQRAFAKDNYQLVYINRITNEIKLKSDIEEEAIKEYQEVKEKYIKEKKEKEKKANIVKVLPRGKIAPIGRKKILEDPFKKREKEFLKKMEIQMQEKEKEKENQDEEIRQLNEKIKKDKDKENLFIDLNISNDNEENKNEEIKLEENSENGENDNVNFNNNINYDKKNEFNSKEKKFPNKFKNLIKNNLKNNNKNSNSGSLVLNLNDSNDNIDYKNNNNIHQQFKDNKLQNNLKVSPNRDKNKDENRSENIEDDNNNDFNKKKIRNKIKYEKTPSPQNNNSQEEQAPKIQRNNKKRKSIDKNYHFDKQKIKEIEIKDNDDDYDKSSINNEDNKFNNSNSNYENYNNYQNLYNNMENKNDNSDIFDENNDEKLKNKYLKNIKKEFKKRKKKFIKDYIQNKKLFIKEFKENNSNEKKNKIKKYESELKEDLSNHEKDLKNKMNMEVEKYKKYLIEKFKGNYNCDDEEDGNSIKGSIIVKNLELKKNNLEWQINLQKQTNDNKNENEKKKINDNTNKKKKHFEEMNKIKISRLDLKAKNKIIELTKKLELDFDNYKIELEAKNSTIKDNSISKVNNNKDSFKEILEKYSKDSDLKLEENKKTLKEEYENKLKLEIEEFINNNSSCLDKGNCKQNAEEKKIIEKDYYTELNTIKNNNKEIQNKLNEAIANIINKTSKNFEQIKNRQSKDINSLFMEIGKKIKKGNENRNDENGVDDYLDDIISDKKTIMSKYNSLVDMTENEFDKNKYLLQYYIDVFRGINQILSNNIKINDEIKINDIFKFISDINNNYKEKIEKEKNNKLLPFLYKAFQKIMNLSFNDENTNNIIDNSIYGQFMLNNNNSINITCLNNNNLNNTILNESNIFKNNINNKLNNSNANINSSNQRNNNLNDNNNLKLNQTFNSTIQNQNINSINNTSSFSPKKANIYQNFLNKTFSNNINPIYEESNENENNMNNLVPQLPNNILNNFSPECIQKYEIIINFLIEEAQNISEELNFFNNQKNSKNQLDDLIKSGEFSKYNNILNQICREEYDKSNQNLRKINSKSKSFQMIKNNVEENFKFIQKYPNRHNITISKLDMLINEIDNYYIKYSVNLNNYNSLMKSNIIENMMNNTFNIDMKENKIYNINENSNFNTIQSSHFYNNYMHNLSHL